MPNTTIVNAERMLENFLSYVQVDTTAAETTTEYPSSSGQMRLGAMLVDQLRSIGIENAQQDERGIVMATVTGNRPGAPVVCFNAHLDTSPETSGANVRPQVIRNYDGRDITLPGNGAKICVSECPELQTVLGQTIVTTDGTTLLGGDDKAGVAIIMELAHILVEQPDLPHGDIRLLFTCDEEVGRGTKYADLEAVDAVVCYTFDGGGRDEVDIETFSADLARVSFRGTNIHPSIAKGKMVNAVRAAGVFIDSLPRQLSPEATEGREGFMHPYVIQGGVGDVELRVLLRSFETAQLQQYADQLRELARQTENSMAGIGVDVSVEPQYRNMADGLSAEPRAVQFALAAHRNLGREPRTTIIRGGTDGSAFTEKGLPTPNLSSGQHNIHSNLEWASLDEMTAACEVGIEIAKLWSAASE